MSSAVVSTSAALGRPFVFEDEAEPELGSLQGSCEDDRPPLPDRAKLDSNDRAAGKILPSSVVPASRLSIRPTPEMVSSGISALDALTGGLPRGCLTEICGPASSGRTSLLLAALAGATRRGEFCALIDASDTLDPHSAAAAGVDLEHLLWVRCNDAPEKENSPQKYRVPEKLENHNDGVPILSASSAARVGKAKVGMSSKTSSRININGSERPSSTFKNAWKENIFRQSEHRLEQVLRATDLLLESGGFGLIVLDLADLPTQAARRIPLTTWFRFRRAIENKPTILLAIEQHPIAGSCSSLLLQLETPNQPSESGILTHTNLFTELHINAESVSRLDRKPARSVAFVTKTAWAG